MTSKLTNPFSRQPIVYPRCYGNLADCDECQHCILREKCQAESLLIAFKPQIPADVESEYDDALTGNSWG